MTKMMNLNAGWAFQMLPRESVDALGGAWQGSFDESCFAPVDLPHTWYVDGNAYKGTVVYRRELSVRLGASQRAFLQFQAADRWCRVYLNGAFVGEHKGGYSAFAFDVTEHCRESGENELLVFLDNRSFDEISPLAGDFTVFGGLYRDVNLIVTDGCCFDRTYYGTCGVIVRPSLTADGQGTVSVEPHVLGADAEMSVIYQVCGPDGQPVAKETCDTLRAELTVPNPVLWNGKESPALYTLRAQLCRNGELLDEVALPFGFRNVRIDAEKGFFLNDRPMKIQGVAKHQDFGEVFNATGPEHWEQDMCDILEVGANSVRLSHYQHPQQMYDLCDEKGLIVWAEIPMLRLDDSIPLFENACSQMTELILQNLHHPSICFWGIQNEIAMFGEGDYTYVRMGELNALVKSLDPTRISACANLYCVRNDSPLNRITDAVGYNIYFGWYYGEMKDNLDFVESFHRDNPSIPLCITEYGVDCNPAYHSDTPKVKDYSEEYQALYHETVYPIFRSKPYVWGTYIWNFYDFSSEIRDEGGVKYKNTKGLITFDRQIRKDAFYYYKAQWSAEPFVKIAQERYVNRAAETITVKVYSNQGEVTLSVNGAAYTARSDSGVFLFEGIALQKGDNTVRAVSGPCADEVHFCGVDEPDPSYTFVDANPGLNVKNWFTDMLEEEKLFPKGRLSIRESSDTLLKYDEAMQVLEEFSPKLASQMRERGGSMKLERILYYMKGEFTDEQCKALNARLTTIRK